MCFTECKVKTNQLLSVRDIKFRARHSSHGSWIDWAVNDQDDEFWLDADPETIGQFTNLHDKNGKEIYEGDIVKLVGRIKEPQIVGYDSDLARFCFVYESGEVMRSFSQAEKLSFEVIGNIYENPDLLK